MSYGRTESQKRWRKQHPNYMKTYQEKWVLLNPDKQKQGSKRTNKRLKEAIKHCRQKYGRNWRQEIRKYFQAQ